MPSRPFALECAAVFDAAQAVGVADSRLQDGYELLVRIVSMLTKMIR
jgi:hypothetical protein